MKVLKEGTGWSIEKVCTGAGNGGGGCGSLLSVEINDIYLTSSTDWTGETDYYYTFRCPCCGVETDIPERDLPSHVKSEARANKRRILR